MVLTAFCVPDSRSIARAIRRAFREMLGVTPTCAWNSLKKCGRDRPTSRAT